MRVEPIVVVVKARKQTVLALHLFVQLVDDLGVEGDLMVEEEPAEPGDDAL